MKHGEERDISADTVATYHIVNEQGFGGQRSKADVVFIKEDIPVENFGELSALSSLRASKMSPTCMYSVSPAPPAPV